MRSGAIAPIPGEIINASPALLRNRNFLVPYLAETQSVVGDQVGRVALSILVFDRTDSAAWTALTYALTFLPAIAGGFMLGGVGDRFSRVRVMILADVARAALFCCVAIPGLPLPVTVGMVAVAFFLGPAFTAAMVSRLAAALMPEHFRAASGLRMITFQVAQVGGFAIGGVIVAVVHPRAALILNASTFAFSALIVGLALGFTDRLPVCAPTASHGSAVSALSTPVPPTPKLWHDPSLRRLMLMTSLAAFFVVPEGLAVPLSHDLGVGNSVTGLLLAAGPLGAAFGVALLVTLVPHRNGMNVARLMSVGCGVPLLITALLPPWPVVLLAWAISGALWAYQVDVAAAVVRAVDERVRSRAIARASSVLLGAQGAGLFAFGGLGGWLGAQWGIALAGLVGVCAASAVAVMGAHLEAGKHSTAARRKARPQSLSL